MPLDHVEDGAMVYPVSSYDDERAIGMRIRVATEAEMSRIWPFSGEKRPTFINLVIDLSSRIAFSSSMGMFELVWAS